MKTIWKWEFSVKDKFTIDRSERGRVRFPSLPPSLPSSLTPSLPPRMLLKPREQQPEQGAAERTSKH